MSLVTKITQKITPRGRISLRWGLPTPIAKKFTVIMGIIIFVLLVELYNFYFSMKLMSAIRTWIAAEDSWSKAQKSQTYNLFKYSTTYDDADYNRIFTFLDPYLGFRNARIEMEKPTMDYAVVRSEFIRGGMHPDDISDCVFLFRWFRNLSYIDFAVRYWVEADTKVEGILDIAEKVHIRARRLGSLRQGPERDRVTREIDKLILQAKMLDDEATILESNFAAVLGDASRFVKSALTAVTTVLTAILGAFTIVVARLVQQTTLNAVESKSEFLSITSHQLRSPIAHVRWALETLKDAPLTPEYKDLLKTAHEATLHMTDTVKKMLMISRMETGSHEMQLTRFKLREVIEKIVSLLENDRLEKSLTLDVQCNPGLVVTTDEQLLMEILQNLLTNAYKYTPQRGYVSVHVSTASDGMVRVDVTDTGCGIPLKDQRSIARKFFRASNVAGNKESGTGIGLYMVYSMVEMIGGTISFTSQENKGTTFTLSFPVQGKANS